MIGAMRLYKCVEQMQKCIDNKTLDNIDEIYISLIKEMNIFFKELVIFSNNIDHPISPSIIREFEVLSRECDLNENNKIKTQINSNDTGSKNDENIIDVENGQVVVDRPVNGACCNQNCILM